MICKRKTETCSLLPLLLSFVDRLKPTLKQRRIRWADLGMDGGLSFKPIQVILNDRILLIVRVPGCLSADGPSGTCGGFKGATNSKLASS